MISGNDYKYFTIKIPIIVCVLRNLHKYHLTSKSQGVFRPQRQYFSGIQGQSIKGTLNNSTGSLNSKQKYLEVSVASPNQTHAYNLIKYIKIKLCITCAQNNINNTITLDNFFFSINSAHQTSLEIHLFLWNVGICFSCNTAHKVPLRRLQSPLFSKVEYLGLVGFDKQQIHSRHYSQIQTHTHRHTFIVRLFIYGIDLSIKSTHGLKDFD